MLATVEKLDLNAFYTSYRGDDHGRAAHDPEMMVALLLYEDCRGQRSPEERLAARLATS
jgi:transposase